MRKEKVLHWIARNLPRSVVYWCGIVLWANATTGEYSHTDSPSVRMDEALERWES